MSYVIYNIRIFHTILPQIWFFFLFKQSVSSGLSCFSVVVWHYSWLTENNDWRWPLTTAGNDCDVWWTGTRRSPPLTNARQRSASEPIRRLLNEYVFYLLYTSIYSSVKNEWQSLRCSSHVPLCQHLFMKYTEQMGKRCCIFKIFWNLPCDILFTWNLNK